MQTTPSISNLLNYIYLLLAVAGTLLIVVASFLIQQGSGISQQEKMLSGYLLPTLFDLQRLDNELVKFQITHTEMFQRMDSQDVSPDYVSTTLVDKKNHILATHAQPIQRFINNINDTSRHIGIKIFQTAMERLHNNHLHFKATLDKFFDPTALGANLPALTQSIEVLNTSIRQLTRLHQREANTLTNNLNNAHRNNVWKITGVVTIALFLGTLVAIRIISLTKSAITQQQTADAELLQHKDHLEQLVQERTFDLESSNKELESYSYSIAHDLLAPLRAISGFSQILLTETSQKLNAEEKDNLTRISNAGIRMAELIDDILALSTVTRAELQPQKTDLSLIAQTSINQRDLTDIKHATDIRIQENLIAYADRELIQLAIDHLLGNAIKYSSTKETAYIEFGAENINDEITYFVRDNGIGFEMQYADKLFQAFERVQDKNSLDGSGIGLAMVHRVITKHGGRIWADAAVDQGATFYFTLPENPRRTTTTT